MSKINYNQASFLLSAVALKHLPEDNGNEVAFIGRSNAGKSSAINTLTGIKGLARSSKTPGRTQAINIFKLNDNNRLMDLPGYGFTKAPLTVSKKWMQLVNDYLQDRGCLKGLVLIMDIRHPLKEQDVKLLDWAVTCQLKVHILLSKADKLKKGPANNALLQVKKAIEPNKSYISVQLFSSLDKIGLSDLQQQLDKWFA
ncbi:MAG: YihA family ribosome biogenesis GTP-binding protein [Gammaproteobacteria bacterium]|nr:YihA family ribosome biogenesis GTP-binding protein [Gammaproteobacteria bacterium]